MSESHASPRKVRAAQRKREALGLRAQGLPFRQIGEQLGVSKQRATRMVNEELDKVQAVTAEEATALKRQLLENYQRLIGAWWRLATGVAVVKGLNGLSPDKDAANVVLKGMAQLAKLAGLDAPLKVQGGPLGPLADMTDAELDEELRRHRNVFETADASP